MESIENFIVESVWEIEIFINKLTDKILLLEISYLVSIHYKGQRRDDTYTL